MVGWRSALAAGCGLLAALEAGCAGPRQVVEPAASPAGVAERRGGALARGEEALRASRFAEAEALLGAAVADAPADPAPLVARARARLGLRRPEEAMRDLDAALALSETAAARALRGGQLGRLRRFDAAAADLERAVALDPADGEAFAALAAVQVNRGDVLEAEHAFAGAVRVLGPVQGADRTWTQLLSMPPDPVQPQESLDRCSRGRVAMLEGRWVDAHAEHLNAMRYAPRYAWCAAGMAEVTWRLGDVATAEAIFRRAIAAFPEGLAPLRADAEGRLAAFLVAQGRAAEALGPARAAAAARPDRAAVLDALARACDAAGDAACARDAYGRLLARPRLPDALRTHAETRLAALR